MNNKTFNTIHDHTYDESIIDYNGWVLDLGCNDFIVSKHFLDKGLKVIALDPIKDINIPQNLLQNQNFYFINKACVGLHNAPKMMFFEYIAPGANSLYNSPEKLHNLPSGHANNPFKDKYLVETITIKEILQQFQINQFEIIKMDVEGAEYDILENLPEKCAKQISVEFHDFLDLNPMKDCNLYHDLLDKKMSNYSRYPNPETGLDDVLFLLN